MVRCLRAKCVICLLPLRLVLVKGRFTKPGDHSPVQDPSRRWGLPLRTYFFWKWIEVSWRKASLSQNKSIHTGSCVVLCLARPPS